MEEKVATLYLYNFQYTYDAKKQKFIVPVDLESFTVADFSWDWIEDHQIYNIKIVEKRRATMVQDMMTGEWDVTYKELGAVEMSQYSMVEGVPDLTTYNFDVSKRGEYLGMPRIEDSIRQAYKKLNIDHFKLS